jgi:hypothetical protein
MSTSNAGLWDSLRSDALQWLPERGIGYFPVTESPYDGSYWENYRAMDKQPSGVLLTALRCELVGRYRPRQLVDIGIGGGRFCMEAGSLGFDINPHAIEWLKATGRFFNPYERRVYAASFWDSLEHIHDPTVLLANIDRYVFASLPIFKDAEDILGSKHFKKQEHCWYFTASGFEAFMLSHGFQLVDSIDMEQAAGREQILTFVFERVSS